MTAIPRILVSSMAVAVLGACLEPVDQGPVGYSPHLLDADADVEPAAEDSPLALRIRSNAGVRGEVALHTAFADGAEVSYWDFGPASSRSKPVWVFRKRRAGKSDLELDHLPLIDTVPGDDGYGPMRTVFAVHVTDAYDGERITSFDALEHAVEIGLVEAPEPLEHSVSWPIVPPDTTLERGDDRSPLEPEKAYYRGHVVHYFALGADGDDEGRLTFESRIPTPPAYFLRRVNEAEPLDESLHETDFNEDGDERDTNVLFDVPQGNAQYSSLWRRVDVTVAADYLFGDSQAAADLFVDSKEEEGAVRPELVTAFPETGEVWNLPQYKP